MKAIVMAGGEGTRLRPLTCTVPKPMVTLLGKPILEYTTQHLFNHKITDMAFTLMYKPSIVIDYFEDKKDEKIEYFIEDTPLGTAGSVKNASSFIDDTFLVISGDALTDIDITKAYEFHKSKQAKATIVLKKMGSPLEYGVVIAGERGGVERFLEKPGWEDVFSDTVNTGIYIIEPEVLDLIPASRQFDFAKDLFPLMMDKKMPIFGYIAKGYWCDVGNIESYIKAHEDLLNGEVRANIKGKCIDGIYICDGVDISNSALIQSPCFIGEGAVIGTAKIGSYSSIGKGARIAGNANIKRSIVHAGASIGKNTKLSSCVVAERSVIGQGCSIYEGAVIGQGCSLSGDNIISPRVKLWPEKWLSAGAAANENIVWGYGERAGFLSKAGFVGDIGADVTPIRLSRIFGAAAEYLSGKSAAVCSDDTAFGNAVLKQAAGIFTMGGVDVFSMRGVTKPVCAYAAQTMNAGLCISIKMHKQTQLHVDLYEPDIFMLSKNARKKIEAKYFMQGERFADKTCGKETQVSSADDFYINTLYEKIDVSSIEKADVCVLIIGEKKIDDFAQRVFSECNIRVKRHSGGKDFTAAEALRQQGADFAVKLSRNAKDCMIYLDNGRVLGTDEFCTLAYYLIFSSINTNDVKLPSSVQKNVTDIAHMIGLNYTYVSQQESLYSLAANNRRLLFDAIYAVCRLFELIARTGTTINEIAQAIEPGHIRVRQIGCGWEDIGRVIKTVYNSASAYANEGIRFDDSAGYGYICPHSTRPKIIVRTEGYTEEFADELCEKYTNMVRNIIKK